MTKELQQIFILKNTSKPQDNYTNTKIAYKNGAKYDYSTSTWILLDLRLRNSIVFLNPR